MTLRSLILGASTILSAIVLMAEEPTWGLVRVSVACMRTAPRHSAELSSQAIMGTPLLLDEKENGFWKVQTPDGYEGYIIANSIVTLSDSAMIEWRQRDRVVMTSKREIQVTDKNGTPVSDMVNGSIVEGHIDKVSGLCHIIFPDGRTAIGQASDFMEISLWANQNFDASKIIDMGMSMMGTPYLWGGMSTKSLDCSGYVRVCYFHNGRILPRDAWQQALVGTPVYNGEPLKTGDLLMFGNSKTGRVTHVAIYHNDGNYIHSSGMVRYNSLFPDASNYNPISLLQSVRINGSEGSAGISKVIAHPWYFNIDK